jgi:hypothetical protein
MTTKRLAVGGELFPGIKTLHRPSAYGTLHHALRFLIALRG